MRICFNTNNRPHQQYFGADAFYDLDQTGAQAQAMRKVRTGEYYVVVKREGGEKLRFDWWKCKGTGLMSNPSQPGVSVNVLYGEFVKTEVMAKEEAFQGTMYRDAFNKNGGLKRGISIC